MTFALGLLVAGVLSPLLARAVGRAWALRVAALLLVAGLWHDVAPVVDLARVADAFERVALLGVAGTDRGAHLLLVAALVWCGPAADLLVRRVLDVTGLAVPGVESVGGLGAGRWIGRLERWLLVLCVAAGQPALAVIPIGGKALFRYAEVVADARADRPQLARPDAGPGDRPARDALVDYVIVGSLASWTQAIALGLLAAT